MNTVALKPRLTPAERYAMMEDGERQDIIDRTIDCAKDKWCAETGQSSYDFLIMATDRTAEWLCLFATELGIEYLHALAGVHNIRDRKKYQAAELRLAKAKAALHDEFKRQAAERAANA